MKRSTFLRAAPLLLAGSCATTTANQPTRTSLTVGSHTQTADQPHPPNNYWFATGDGSVVIDAHWRLSTARTVLEKMRAAGLSTPRYLILTHDHTDHYGGSPVLRRAGAAVLASPLTRLSIKNDAYGFQRGRRELFGEDFPATPPVVDRTVNDGEALRVGNYTLRFHDRPANEATTTTLVEVENTDALFVGDFVYDRFYAIFDEGLNGLYLWRQQLAAVRASFGEHTFYPGHGTPRRGRDIIDAQLRFLDFFGAAAEDLLDRGQPVTDAVVTRVAAEARRAFPDYRTVIGLEQPAMVRQSLAWLVAELDRQVEG